MSPFYKVIIPVRYASTRLPGKALLKIGDKTLIQHVYEAAILSKANEVIIATDDERISDNALQFTKNVMLTSAQHRSGTDRIAEAVTDLQEPDDTIIVNVQGDEYGLSPALVDQVAELLHSNPDKSMATLCENITVPGDFENPNIVKVIADVHNNAIYFSRSPIPWYEGLSGAPLPQGVFRHVGLYAYRTGFLKAFSRLPACALEQSERLEQLRAIYHGFKIHVQKACSPVGIGIDTVEDLEEARRQYKN